MRQAVQTAAGESVAVTTTGDTITLEVNGGGQTVAARLLSPDRAMALACALHRAAMQVAPAWDRMVELALIEVDA